MNGIAGATGAGQVTGAGAGAGAGAGSSKSLTGLVARSAQAEPSTTDRNIGGILNPDLDLSDFLGSKIYTWSYNINTTSNPAKATIINQDFLEKIDNKFQTEENSQYVNAAFLDTVISALRELSGDQIRELVAGLTPEQKKMFIKVLSKANSLQTLSIQGIVDELGLQDLISIS